MASLTVLAFDPEGRPVAFDTWHDDLQLYLLSDLKDSVSLFDHVSGAAPAPPSTADVSTRSQWLSRDSTARLAIRNHLSAAECAHFGEHRTAQALYDTVVARYSSPATCAIGRLLLPYMFPVLSAFATVADLVTHLRTSDARYRAAVPAEVKRPPGSPPAFKARYVARGFSQRHGVDYFHTFSPTPKMTTLRVLLHVAAQRDYELHSLDFSTAFLQGSLHEEIWLRRLPGFTGTFPAGTQWSLRRPVYGLRKAPREWHDTLRTTLLYLPAIRSHLHLRTSP
ncbi:unnamed protein product [Closterium sp. NIES-53]